MLGLVIFFLGLYLVEEYLQERPYEEFHGSNLTFTSEQKALFLSFLKDEDIPYRTDSTGYLHYHLSGHAKVKAFNREIHGTPDYDAVAPMDSAMETLMRKEFDQAEIPYTVRMVGNSQTINITFDAKYSTQVDLIDQKAWLDWARRLQRMNEAARGYPK